MSHKDCGQCSDSDNSVRPVYAVGDEAEEVGEAQQEEMAEGRDVVTRMSPKQPSIEERRTHNLTHIPYRNWCAHCVAARGRNFPHKRSEGEKEDQHPCVHLDYCFPRDTVGGESVPVLVARFSDSKSLAGHVVPHKGASHRWSVDQVCRDLRKFGLAGTVILRSDQEPALVDLLKEVAKVREASGMKTIIEHSAVGESQANGTAEQAVQAVEGIMRTMKLDLEEKLGRKVPVTAPVFAWLVEHSADVTNKCHVFLDGTTSFEKVKGRKHRGELHEFGAQVLLRLPGKAQGGLMEARWIPGTWLGKRFATEEHIVATVDGKVVKARAVRPVAVAERWNSEKVLGVKGVPWSPSGEERPETPVEYEVAPAPKIRPVDAMDEMENAPRSMAITSRHLDRVGYTAAGCAKCRAMIKGETPEPRGHSAVCRARVYKAIRQDEVMKNDMERADERKERYLKRRAEDVAERGPQEEHGGERINEMEVEAAQADGGDANGETAIDIPAADAAGSSRDAAASGSSQDGAASGSREGVVEGRSAGSSGMKRDREEDEEEGSRPTAYRQTEEDAADSDATEDRNELEWRPPADMEVEQPQPRRPALGNLMEKEKHEEMDVCEAFSRPRTAARARKRGLKGGWSLDLMFEDPCTGRRWDLSDPADQKRCLSLLRRTRPKLLVVSPPCTLFSALQALSGGVKDKAAYAKAVCMLEFAAKLCEEQYRAGRLFVFEHPASATSWRLPCLMRLASLRNMYAATFHMCQFGMTQEDQEGTAYIKKATRILSNSEAIDSMVERKCPGGHRHIPLLNGRAKQAEEYPEALCDAFIVGLLVEISRQKEEQLGSLYQLADMCDPQEEEVWKESLEKAWDDITGEEICPKLVKEARAEEMKGFQEFGVYEHVLRSDAKAEGGKKIGVRWVDINKGTKESPKIRSRLVGQEFAGKELRDDLFAATPPLAATRTLLSLAASKRGTEGSADSIMVLDVKKAFLHGRIQRTVYIELPSEDPMSESKQYVGRLVKAMYGTRDAPAVWQQEVKKTMTELGFSACLATPCVYYNAKTKVRVVVHVDDMLCTGSEEELVKLRGRISEKYQITSAIIGHGSMREKECRFLGRTVRWTRQGIEWIGDAKLREALIKEWGMSQATAVSTPIVKEEAPAEGGRPMNDRDAGRYRRAAAQINYLSLDNPFIAFAAKELSRRMARPEEGDEVRIKRVVRFLIGCPGAVYRYPWQDSSQVIQTFTDSDWAGCSRTRRSTSGGAVHIGGHLISHWSKTQQTVALSSGEAELNATLKGACESLGQKYLMEELGVEMNIQMYGDSSASQGTIQRQGSGRIKHLSVRQLWIQERVALKELDTFKIPRAQNRADALTHSWTGADTKHFLRMNISPAVVTQPR